MKSNTSTLTIKRLFRYISPYRFLLIFSLIFAILGISLSLYMPVLIGKAIDLMIGAGSVDFSGIITLCLYLLLILLFSSLFQWIMSVFANKITYRTVKDLRKDAFSKLSTLPLDYIDTHTHGDIVNRIINDADLVSDGLFQAITQLFSGIVTISGTLIFMLYIHPLITIAVVLITPLSLFVASFIASHTHRFFREQAKLQGKLNGFVRESVENLKLIKAFHYEDTTNKKFQNINDELKEIGTKAQFYSSLTNPSTRFINNMVFSAVGIFGALNAIGLFQFLGTALTIGKISAFLAYANQYTKPFNEVTGVITQLQTTIASAARIFSLIDEKDQSLGASKILSPSKGYVKIDKVSFSYTPKTRLIENLSLSVKSGSRIAIVGPTGSGKTTLINLLMRFYDVLDGNIYIDDTDIYSVTRESVRKQFGMILQETWLFSGTIRDNIAYGKPNAELWEIISAAKSAYADNFIKRLPDGYDTIISEQGDNLSSGQKQLICIARIMLISPPMLILDEATSSIDTMTEQRIQKAFSQMMKNKTSFIVAHRLSTIRDADLILVLNNGNIVEQGNHEELLAIDGLYSSLYHSNSHNI